MSAYILGVLSAGDSDQQDLAFSIEPEKNNQTKVFHFQFPQSRKIKTLTRFGVSVQKKKINKHTKAVLYVCVYTYVLYAYI